MSIIKLLRFCNKVGSSFMNFFQGNSKIILMFHSICDFNNYKKYSISSDYFCRILRYLIKNFEIVDLPEILENDYRRTKISITFDDGYQNIYFNALPIIREFKIPVTIFFNSSFIGNQSNKIKSLALDSYEDIMTANQIRELIRSDLVTIGNHTKTHPDFRKIKNEEILKDEIIGGKTELEKKFNIEVNRFSYPYGILTQKSIEIVSKSHKYAVYGLRGNNYTELNQYYLPRINAAQNWTTLKWNISDTGTRLSNIINKSTGIISKKLKIPSEVKVNNL